MCVATDETPVDTVGFVHHTVNGLPALNTEKMDGIRQASVLCVAYMWNENAPKITK
jgi:hypothetical protein